MAKYKLEDVCEIITDGTHKTPEYCDESGYIFLSSKDVTSKKINWSDVKYIPEKLHHELHSRLAPRKGDVLLAKNGTTGVAALVDRDEVFDIYVSLALLRPKNNVFPKYLLYAVNSPVAKRQFDSGLKGIGVPNLHLSVIRKTEIDIPEMEMQVQICDKLEKLAAIIECREQELKFLDALIKSRFVELFDIQKCQRKPLGECTDFVDYRGHTPELSDAGTIRMVNAKSVGKGFFKYVDEYVTEDTYNSWMHRGFGYPGDILFVTEGHTFGNTCLIPDDLEKFALGQRVITIKGHQELLNAFLCSYMQTDMFWQDINVYRTGGTAQGIRSKDLVKVYVPIPPMELQEQFAAFVEQTDKLKVEVQKSLDETQQLMDSLMQNYFG